MNSRLVLFIVSLFLFVVSTNSASALTISPARIEVNGDPGTTITKEITLLNDSQNKDTEETYYISYSNFEAQGETGSPLFVDPKSGLGTWMNAGDSVTLKAGESKKIPLTINIPSDAYAGGHFAVVFFGNNPGNGGQVSVGAKTGTLVLLTVNGDVLEAGGLSYFNTLNKQRVFNSLPVSFEYRWKNDGNDRVKPSGEIVIRNMFYIPVEHLDANAVSGNVLPHSTRLFNAEWLKYKAEKGEEMRTSFVGSFVDHVVYQWKNFALGAYFAKLDLTYGTQGDHSTKTAVFFVLPWQLIVVIVVILALIIFIGRKMLKAYNKSIIEKARLSVTPPNDANHA